jgi:hypothetical protein
MLGRISGLASRASNFVDGILDARELLRDGGRLERPTPESSKPARESAEERSSRTPKRTEAPT